MLAFLSLALLSLLANAAVTPTSPESATVVRIGQPLSAMWAADTTGQWTDMTVQLMTGDNLNMIPLTTLSTGIDGTKDRTHSWTTPNVSPTSKIYFLQFTRTGDPTTAQWTTRFTIAAADGTTSQPTNSTTYTPAQGPVQWGIGAVVGGSGSGSPSIPVSNSTSPSASGAAGIASGGVPTISVQSSSMSVAPSSASSTSTSMSSMSMTTSRSSGSSVSAASAAAASSSKAAAGKLEVGGMMGMVLAMIGAAVLA